MFLVAWYCVDAAVGRVWCGEDGEIVTSYRCSAPSVLGRAPEEHDEFEAWQQVEEFCGVAKGAGAFGGAGLVECGGEGADVLVHAQAAVEVESLVGGVCSGCAGVVVVDAE